MTSGLDPFAQQPSNDPFAPQEPGPPVTYGAPGPGWQMPGGFNGGAPGGSPYYLPPPAQQKLNTFAVLAPIFGVVLPPVGVAFGHIALPQIKRTGERGWLAAVCGLVIGYLMCALLVVSAIWLLAGRDRGAPSPPAAPPPAATPSEEVVTSIAPPPVRMRKKIDLNNATVGMCVEIQLREGGDQEALDLFEVPCERRAGVYRVIARVSDDVQCNSTYVAAPPDRTFAVCLNRY